ncbi:xanthine dehydrogenase YagS FAD-binding subunit [Trinickia symbiotica]|uniref:Xanthine dehydrogenase family protein subunit M n=1 Tax=Trinickia symbiotica TaxID=863227 RepID=A0A2N7X204_9BURK|nr:xanthine dehydrogenase family protein subunit M [Trinickia symbiotica]PMS35776.1 xanthine dehydrogenase family protein subunit M [Trinickia symbiotica]PPK44601.1 xanthine dehydrogenase YagS FAD-binding subunit [Trinickia symbiotica]
MNDFGYERSATVEDCLATIAAKHAAIIAGGTELLNWVRLGIAAPPQLVDIGGIRDLDTIAIESDHLVIGALANLNAIGEHPLVATHANTLAHACLQAASPQVRNRATLGGNVLQKTRCAYFRAETPLPWPCNKREPNTGCAARNGVNDRQAIFGWTDECVAVQPSDPAVALACLDAQVEIAGANGSRSLAMTEFHLTQAEAAALGDAARHETRLADDEMIVAFRIPLHAGSRSAYVKVRERASYEYALVSAAAVIKMTGDVIERVSIALGSVAQRPWRLPAAETALVGQSLDAKTLASAIDAAMKDARPLAENGFKVKLARNAAVRAILTATGRS